LFICLFLVLLVLCIAWNLLEISVHILSIAVQSAIINCICAGILSKCLSIKVYFDKTGKINDH